MQIDWIGERKVSACQFFILVLILLLAFLGGSISQAGASW